MPQNAVELNNLSFSRGSRTILNGINATITEGSVVAIMGPSGAGKTTILRLISGQLRPDGGSIRIFGRDIHQMNRSELFAFRRQIGVLLQNGALFTDLTVFENIATPVREHTGLPEALIRRLVMSKLNAVGLGGTENLMPHELSGGMARRIAFARAVALDPSLMLYDEPLTGLDPIAVSTVSRLIRETNDALGLTSIIVTHNVVQMQKLADYCIIIADREIAGAGHPKDLADSDNPKVRQFMNGEVDGPIPFRYQSEHQWSLTG